MRTDKTAILSLDLNQLQREDQRTVRGDVVYFHGAIAPFRGDVDFPLVAFMHAGEGDLPAHDEVSDQEEGRERSTFRGVEDGTVYQLSRVVDIYDASGGGLLGSMPRLQNFVKDSVVQNDDSLFLGLDFQEGLVGFLVWIVVLFTGHNVSCQREASTRTVSASYSRLTLTSRMGRMVQDWRSPTVSS